MDDRYLCRAKRIDNGEWVEGYLLNVAKLNAFICTGKIKLDGALKGIISPEMSAVDPSTICQCIGLKGIYEHDIFECDGETYEIVFDQDDLVWWADGYGHQYIQLGEFKPNEIKVVGNIFDNPELLEYEG